MNPRRRKEVPVADRPYTSNYPVLQAWLSRRAARCVVQVSASGSLEDYTASWIEQWMFRGGATATIIIHPMGRGWDVLTSIDSNNAEETLRDAEIRLGLSTEQRR